MKKVLSLGIIVLMLCSIFSSNKSVLAAETSGVDYAKYKPGVTVEANAASQTGYYATFIYEDKTGAATKVELYSDCFNIFTIETGFANPYKPEEYRAGMFPAGGNADTTYYLSMEKLGLYNSLWGIIIPPAATPTGVFLIRQYLLTVPDELIEAARIDGAGVLSIWTILLASSFFHHRKTSFTRKLAF